MVADLVDNKQREPAVEADFLSQRAFPFGACEGVDEIGLDEFDRRFLRTLIEKFDGGPVGAETIAATLQEERDTVEDVVEPYLMQLGFLNRTPRGRMATRGAYEHLGIPYRAPGGQPPLL